MAEDWSREEVAATVADQLAMLEHELRGESYNKGLATIPDYSPMRSPSSISTSAQ